MYTSPIWRGCLFLFKPVPSWSTYFDLWCSTQTDSIQFRLSFLYFLGTWNICFTKTPNNFLSFQNGMIIVVILITWMTSRVWPAAPKWGCLRHAVLMAPWESGTRPIDSCVSSNWMPLQPAFVSVVRKVTWLWVLANIFTKSTTLPVSVQRVLKVFRNALYCCYRCWFLHDISMLA